VKKLILLSLLLASGCALDTRSQVKQDDERSVMRKQVANLQQTTADVNTRFADVEEDVRRANGRIEALETRLSRNAQDQQGKADQASQALSARLADNDKAYREEFKALHAEIDALKAQFEARRASEAAAATAAAKDPFGTAESKFESKNYKEAILDYQAYRRQNPSGKHFSTATYKIGVSFQEMGMIDEARAFYDEVIAKFPKSKDAGRAQAKLKALKKK
jgi:TolA-binding protein